MTEQNLFDTWLYAREHKRGILLDACLIFAPQRLEWVIQQAAFGQLPFEEVFYLMNYYESNANEKTRFDVVTAWLNRPQSKSQDMHQFNALLSTVDLSKIPSEVRVNFVANIDKKEFRYVKTRI